MAKKKRKPGKKRSARNTVPDFPLYASPVQPEDTFLYRCSRCGECCRNVKDAVMLESLDAFRLARYLQQSGHGIVGAADVISTYTDPAFLGKARYPIFLMKTTGAQNACVFLKDNRCSAQDAKPRTCRMYPLSAGPRDGGGFDYFIVSQKQRHFTGSGVRVGDWMDENFSAEDREFVTLDFRAAAELAPLLRALQNAGVEETRVLKPLLFFKYFNYELDEPFLPQYTRNHAALLCILRETLKAARP